MSNTRGVITRTYRNDRGHYSFELDGDKWYGTYKTDHSDKDGQTVEFDAEEKVVRGKTYYNAKNVRVVPASSSSGGGSSRAMAGDARQSSIVLQSSYKVAADVLNGLITADKVQLGAKNVAFDAAKALLDEMTLHIYRNCIDPSVFLEDEDEDVTPVPPDDYDPVEA